MACAKNGIPLHGKGNDKGVLECGQLMDELQKLKENSAAMKSDEKSSGIGVAGEDAAKTKGNESADGEAHADMGLLPAEQDEVLKDPVSERASQLALAELSGIHLVHNDWDGFLAELQESIGAAEKLIFVLDAITSKVSFFHSAVGRLKKIVAQLPSGASERWLAVIPVARRFDILSCVHESVATEFKQNNSFVVQCVGSATQTSRQQPTFVIVSQARLCQSEKVPCYHDINNVRAKSWEGLRQRCMNASCRLRDPENPMDEDVPANENEKVEEHTEVKEDDDEEDQTDRLKEKVPESGDVPVELKNKELYPFTRPLEQCDLFGLVSRFNNGFRSEVSHS